MPKPMSYPTVLAIRLEADVPDRIKALRRGDEPITTTQRRVVHAGLAALEGAPAPAPAPALDAAEQPAAAAPGPKRAGRKGKEELK